MPPHHGDMHNAPQKAKDVKATFLRLLGLLRSRRRALLLLFPSRAGTAVAGIVWPRLLGVCIDLIGELGTPDCDAGSVYARLWFNLAVSVAVQAAGSLCQFLTGRGTVNISAPIVREMRGTLFARLLRLPVKIFDRTRHGEFMSRLVNDTSLAGDTIGSGLLDFFGEVFLLLGLLAYMLSLSVKLTLVACATIPLTFVTGRVIIRVSRRLYRERQKTLGEVNAIAEEMISGQRTLQAFCREDAECGSFAKLSARLRLIALRAELVGGVMGPVMNAIGNGSFLLVAAVGGAMAADGSVTVGMVVTFLLYARQFGRPVNSIAGQFNQIQSAIAGAERVFNVYDEKPEPDDGRAPVPENPVGRVSFENVSFRYVPETPVLTDFSLVIEPGRKTAIVGETGSGKTTVISLLARFYDPDSGCVKIDGADIRSFPLAQWRRTLGIVLQEVRLFSGTIAENIAYGAGDVPRERIVEAAELADADEFIRQLPDGYDTVLSQTGTALSQGQCQLLSIARAALADPKILVLDEATSNVDTRTEVKIQRAMMRLLHGRTSVVIAHRLSTVRDADRIVVMDRGAIVGSGTHAELLAGCPTYRRLCDGLK